MKVKKKRMRTRSSQEKKRKKRKKNQKVTTQMEKMTSKAQALKARTSLTKACLGSKWRNKLRKMKLNY